MIALLDKFLRKWLLGLAVTVRNRAQVIIVKMESVEAEKSKGADRKTAPDATQSARSGEPPAHWVRLVKRHAPELLHPGSPYAFPRESLQVLGGEAGMDELSADDIQEPPSANDALKADNARTDEVPTLALFLPRQVKEHDDRRSRRLRPDDKKIGGSGGQPGAAATSAKSQQVDSSQAAPRTSRAGSVEGNRFQSSSAGAEQSPSRQSISPERNDIPAHPQPPVSGMQEAEARAARPLAAPRSPSAVGPVEKSRSAGMQGKNIRWDAAEKFPPSGQTGKRDVQFDRRTNDSQTAFRIDTRVPDQGFVLSETAYQSSPQPRESVNELPPSLDPEAATSATQVKRMGDVLRQALKIGLANEQPRAHPSEDDLKVEANGSRPPELLWPSLPGEKNAEGAEDPQFTATWPSLPGEQAAAAAAFGHQMETHPLEVKPGTLERLRRLDEEQKGMLWSASRF